MSCINRVMVMGYLGQDPELENTNSGLPYTKLSIATTEKRKDSHGNTKEDTEWHNIVVFGKRAETTARYLKKGSKAFVEGKLKTSSWDDKSTGQKRYKTEIIATGVQFMGSQVTTSDGTVERRQSFGGTTSPTDDIPF